jgi:nitrogen regulatory protein P-II 1
MKKIEAFIRPEKIEEIKDVLNTLNLKGLSISQVMGCGNQKGWKGYVRGTEVEVNFLPKIKIETVVHDEQVDNVIDIISRLARTGDTGDGKIFVSDIIEAVRIRTGERGEKAL